MAKEKTIQEEMKERDNAIRKDIEGFIKPLETSDEEEDESEDEEDQE